MSTLEERLATAEAELTALKSAYNKALLGESWETRDGDSIRKITNQNLSVLSREIKAKENEIRALENQIANNGKSGKAFTLGQLW